jgi:hypothetical protein
MVCGHKECHILSLLCLDGYVGIISVVHICRKQSNEAPVKKLEFMAAMWREVEDTHAILLALVYCLQGQVQITVV